MFGLSTIKLLAIVAAVVAVLGAFAVYRQSLINEGWDRALNTVKKQDTSAVNAANRAQLTVDQCYDRDWIWSSITGSCTDPKANKERLQ